MPVKVPDDNFYRVLEPSKPSKGIALLELVSRALDSPVDGLSLSNFAKPGTVAGIILDPIIPKDARQTILEQLSLVLTRIGVSQTKIFLRKRSAVNQPPSPEDNLLQLDPVNGSFTEIGKTTLGTPVNLNQDVLACDLKIAVTLVQPHFVSGFTGGPDTVLPGSASASSIQKNRSLLLKGFPRPGTVSDNQILSDSFEAYRFAGPFYSICLVPDGNGGFETVIAGELESVFRQSGDRFLELHGPKLERRCEIVIASAGHFSSQDLYHAIRIISNVSSIVKRDGTIILVAECSKGIGDSNFLDYARKYPERKGLAAELRYRFKLGAHVNLFLLEMLEKHRIELVSVLPDIYSRDAFQLKPCRTASEAVQKALRVQGKESKILIVNKGDYTLPILETSQTHV